MSVVLPTDGTRALAVSRQREHEGDVAHTLPFDFLWRVAPAGVVIGPALGQS
jgi:hypothetical protein